MERYSCSWIGGVTIVEMASLLKAIYRSTATLMGKKKKKPHDIFHRTRTNSTKICMKNTKDPK